MWFVKEEYKWDKEKDKWYFHLLNSEVFESEDYPEKEEYWEGDSLFMITKLEEDEVQATRRRKSKK
jgi:hypothetical protein